MELGHLMHGPSTMEPPHESSDEGHASPSLPQDIVGSSYNWNEGRFVKKAWGVIPLWLQLLFQTLFGLLVIVGPVLIIYYACPHEHYPLFDDRPPARPNMYVEMMRWIILLAAPYVAYWLTIFLASLVPFAVFTTSKFTSYEPTLKVRKVIEHFLALRHYLGLAMAGAALAILSIHLFPLSMQETALLEARKALSKAPAPSKPAGPPSVTASLASAAAPAEANLGDLSYRFFATRTCIAIAAFLGLLLVEKLVLQRIAVKFHSHSCAGRIEENNFALKIVRRIRKKIGLSSEAKMEESGIKVGERIFDGIVPKHRDTVVMADLMICLTTQDAEHFFTQLDADNHGDLKRQEFALAIRNIYQERSDLSKSLVDYSRILLKLDRLLLVFLWAIMLPIGLMVFVVNMSTTITTLGTGLLGLTFIFGGAARTAFESIVFVIFTHPFDVGDKIVVKGDFYTVSELGLWASTFMGSGKRLTYIANSYLRNEWIINIRRSPMQQELVTVKLHPTVSDKKLRELEARLVEFLLQNSRDYVPELHLKNIKLVDRDHMNVEMNLSHRSNFQNSELREKRTKVFVFFLRDSLTELGIDLAPPYT